MSLQYGQETRYQHRGAPHKFGIVCKTTIKHGLEFANKLIDFFRANNIHKVVIESELAKAIGTTGTPLRDLDVDILITIGGDGTVLKSLWHCKRNPAIFGINAGIVGFLTETDIAGALHGVEKILHGEYYIEERTKLCILSNHKEMGNVINEAVIHTRSVSKMMHYELYVDDVFVNTYKGDGVLVATPTGSTAYAISVGGPLLDPRVNAILVAPIATFKLASRPFLVPIESKIKVKLIEPYRDTTLVLDGQVEHILSAGAEIELMRARSTAKFIRFTHDNFYSRLREKLM